ncbi:MAG: D-aminoacyl-tRNA deacylase [Candidatus Thorarchaeota archaeon]
MRVLVTSEKDIASQTIKQVLIDEHDFRQSSEVFEGHQIYKNEDAVLITSTRDMIHCGHLEDHFEAEAFIFCSRHSAKSEQPALLVHSTGNFGEEALFGGDSFSLSVSSASLVAAALKRLALEKEERDLEQFDVTMEATHHGPTSMNTPLVFIELGSDETYWRHKEGAHVVATAAVECLGTPISGPAHIGFGGSHYVTKFNKLVLQKKLQIGHIAPKYALGGLSEAMIEKMLERTHEKVEAAIIDWKGTNMEQREHILPIIESLGLKLVRAKHF